MATTFTSVVDEHLQDIQHTRTIIETQRSELSEGLKQQIGEAAAQVLITVERECVETLTTKADEIKQAEQQVTLEVSDDKLPREVRDTASDVLYRKVVNLRAEVESLLGRPALSLYGLIGTTPRQPNDLKTFAENAAHLMATNPREATSEFGGGGLNTATASQILKEAITPLAAALEKTTTESEKLTMAQGRRNKILRHSERVLRGVTLVSRGLRVIADREDLSTNLGRREPVRPASGSGEETEEPALGGVVADAGVVEPSP